MDLFSHKGYHGRNKDKPKTYLDKALGLAAVAGLAAAAVYTVRPLAATAAISYARNALIKGASIIGSTGAQEIFSSSYNVIQDIPNEVRRGIATHSLHTKRAETFAEKLVDSGLLIHTQGPNAGSAMSKEQALELIEKNKVRFSRLLNRVSRAKNVNEIENTFLSTKTLNEFNLRSSKLGFKFHAGDNVDAQQNLFRNYSEYAIRVNAKESEAINLALNDVETQKTMIATAKKASANLSKKQSRAAKFLGIGGEIIRESDFSKPEVAKAVNELLERSGSGSTHFKSPRATTIDEIVQHMDKSLQASFTIDGEVNETLVKEFTNLRKEADTGLRLIKKSNGSIEAISIPQILSTVDRGVNRIVGDLQLPLFPGFFSPKLGKMFTGLMPSKEVFSNLREATNHPELMRLLGKSVNSTDHLLGVGDQLLKIGFDPSNPERLALTHIEGEFKFFNKNSSSLLGRVAEARSQEVDNNYLDDPIASLKDYKVGSKKHSKARRFFKSQDYKFAHFDYEKGEGFTVQPIDPSFLPAYEDLYGVKASEDGILRGVDVRDIHVVSLAQLIDSKGADEFNPDQLLSAYLHMNNEATKGGHSISGFLKTTVLDWINHGSATLPEQEDYFVRTALSNIDNPNYLKDLLKFAPPGTDPIIHQTSRLNRDAYSEFNRVINQLRKGGHELEDVRGSEGNLIQRTISNIFGASSVSRSKENLEEGLLGEVLHAKGFQHISNLFGHENDAHGLLNTLIDAKETSKVNDRVMEALNNINLGTGENLSDILNPLLRHTDEGPELNIQNLGRLGNLLQLNEGIFSEAKTGIEKAKIAKVLINDLSVFDTGDYMKSVQKAHLMERISHESDLTNTLAARFLGRSYIPEDRLLDPFSDTRYFATVEGKGLNGFLKGMFDTEAPLSGAGAIMQGMLQRPNHIANMVGLGLPEQDLITAGRSMFSFYAKRILPTFVAYEAYKVINANMHEVGLNGIDDWAANLKGNIQLTLAGAGDATGATDFEKRLTTLIPGLDNYLHPRSEKEQKDYLLYGNEEVHANRLRIIGSRDPLYGSDNMFMRPNYYERYHSHWTEASNVDYSNPAYSYLPSPLHPLAPINLALHPHWWVNKHIKDRPYKSNSTFDPLTSNVNNDQYGDYLTMNSSAGNLVYDSPLGSLIPHKPYGPYGNVSSIGTFGGHSETKLTGGFGGQSLPQPGPTLGPGDSTSQQGSEIHIGLHKQIKESAFNDITQKSADFFTDKFGLYALPLNMMGLTGDRTSLQQTPGYAVSNIRQLFSSENSSMMGPFGAYFRAFARAPQEDYNAYSPYSNNMPSWLPKKFLTGDPYVRTSAGEMNLPGDAFERLHPYLKPLKVRGSVIGYSEKEIIHKWLNPTEEIEGDEAQNIVGFGCVDTETEILTEDGWKTVDKLNGDEVILTLNHDTGFTEWKRMEKLNKYHVNNKELISIESKYHSSLTTPNHRWPIIKKYQTRKDVCGDIVLERFERQWTTSAKLGKRFERIILGAKFTNIPLEKTYSDELVELVAWYWTEGHSIRERSIDVTQSLSINPDNICRIESCLAALFGPMSFDMKTNQKNNPPMWIRDIRYRDDKILHTYRLNAQASECIIKVAPKKVVSTDFIKALTEDQLRLFVDTSAEADGHTDRCIGQKHKEYLEAIELACILLGKRTNFTENAYMYKYKGKEKLYTEYRLGFYDTDYLEFGGKSPNRVTRKLYSGLVWCPTVENSTWCARRNGKVFYTGNSRAHLLIQRQLKQMGILLAAEVPIFDEVNNISGTIDAIVKGSNGYEIFDIKTQGAKGWGTTPDKYIDQINTYMAITGIKKAHLAFVNRDNMKQVRIEDFTFDPERWQRTIAKVNRARDSVNNAISSGKVSPFETYDLLARIEVLSKVAPDSPEFKKLVDYATTSGGFGGFEAKIFEQSLTEAKRLKEKYNLYPYRHNVPTETHHVFVQGINDNGDVVTNKGVIKLAGIKFDSQAFVDEDASKVLSRYGITVGRFIPIKVMQGQFNEDVLADAPIKAIVGSANMRLANSIYASKDIKDRDPLSQTIVNGGHGSSGLEHLVHIDSMLTNKFFRVRSGLEQFERGEVYGTDKFNLQKPFRTFVYPTMTALMSKNPISSSIKGALLGSLLFFSKESKYKAAIIGGSIAGALSLYRMSFERTSGELWKPKRYQKQTELDEYWDIINYLKFTSISEDAKRKALLLEHTSVNRLMRKRDRISVGLGPWATLAIYANKKAKETMYGLDEGIETLNQALNAIPKRHQQIAESIISTGSLHEKQRFYDLLPNTEKRILGKFLNIDYKDLPQKEKLQEFFKTHFLPDLKWKGWNANVDTNDLKTRSEYLENSDIEIPSRATLTKARAYTNNIDIPMVYSPTAGDIKDKINHLLASGGGNKTITASYILRPSTHTHINVEADLQHDDSKEFATNMTNILKV